VPRRSKTWPCDQCPDDSEMVGRKSPAGGEFSSLALPTAACFEPLLTRGSKFYRSIGIQSKSPGGGDWTANEAANGTHLASDSTESWLLAPRSY
jgi:hypothetical protein